MENVYVDLNGTILNGRIGGLDKFTLTIAQGGPDNTIQRKFSNELVFYDDGYDILKAELIDDVEGFKKCLPIDFYDTCCSNKLLFTGEICGDTIDFCQPPGGDCSITASAIERSDDVEAVKCFKSTLIDDNTNGFLNTIFPKMRYCLELRPSFIQDILIFMALGFNITLLTLIPVVAILGVFLSIIGLLCNVVNAIPFVNINCPPVNPGYYIQQYLDWRDELNNLIIGCGRYHPSPLLRDYISNVCQKCGLTFESSILNNPLGEYYNSVMFFAPVEKGAKNSQNINWIEDNHPIYSGKTFMEALKPVFNATYLIRNGTLYFERKDWFLTTAIWLDGVNLDLQNRVVEPFCYSWIDDERPAYARFAYQEDGNDWVGNESRLRFNEIVEWNNPVSPMQSGVQEVNLPFGTVRTRDDGYDQDVYTKWGNIPLMNAIFSGAFLDWTEVILLPSHTCFLPKLLIWDGDLVNGRVKRGYPGYPKGGTSNAILPPNEAINAPYQFVDSSFTVTNLYNNFYRIDDPREPGTVNFDFDFTFKFKCDEFYNFDFDKKILLPFGNTTKDGYMDEVEVDFSTRTIKVKGKC